MLELVASALRGLDQARKTGYAAYSAGRIASAKGAAVLVLVKPEMLGLEQGVSAGVIGTTMETLSIHGEICRVFAFSGQFARSARFVEQNWYVLNRVSRYGQQALDTQTRSRLANVAVAGPTFGGHEILKSVRTSAEGLETAVRAAATVKLGAGVYATNVRIANEDLCVLNGFHPMQYRRFVAADAMWLAVEYSPDISLHALRHEVIGVEPPNQCPPASLKRRTYERLRGEHAIEMSLATNGFHCSPNYVDAALGLNCLTAKDDGTSSSSSSVRLAAGRQELSLLEWVKDAEVSIWNELEDADWQTVAGILSAAGDGSIQRHLL